MLLIPILMLSCLHLSPVTAKEISAADVIIYLDGMEGDDNNTGTNRDEAVATMEKAYERLLAANDGMIANDEHALGVILLCGNVIINNDFNIDKSYTHKGKVIITSKHEESDYKDSAELSFGMNVEQSFQLGGPTEFDDIIFNRTDYAAFVFYAVESLAMGENVVTLYNGSPTTKSTTSSEMSGKFIIRGGYYGAAYNGDILLDIRGGTYWFVSGANARPSGAVNGNLDITVGGNAWVATLVPGTQSAACNIQNSKVTLESGAFVNSLTASGDSGNIENSTIVLKGGIASSILTTRSGKKGTVSNFFLNVIGDAEIPGNESVAASTRNLILSSSERSMELASVWDTFTVNENSVVTLTELFPSNVALTVEKGSRLNLTDGDSIKAWRGYGVVYFEGEEHQNSVHTWDPDTDICNDCGVYRYNVYVDGTVEEPGNGYSAENAVRTLEQAYDILLEGENNKVKENSDAKGTIIVCGEVTIDGQHFNLGGTYEHSGEVTITSVYDNVDYRETNDAKLAIGSFGKGIETRFQCGGPTVFDDIIIHRIDQQDGTVATSLTFYGATSLTMGEGVKTTNVNWDIVNIPPELAAGFKLSAHRGYQPAAPENSIPAFRAAGELGYWAIETDLGTTKDGILVCCHDYTIDRTFNGSGSINEMTLEELYQYKIDTGNNLEEYTDEELRIPLFSEYLAICKEYGALPFIEVKESNADLDKIINEAREYFDDEDIIISSFQMRHLEEARAVSNEVFIHHIVSNEEYINKLSEMGYSGMSFDYNSTLLKDEAKVAEARALIEKAHDAGVQVCLRAGDDLQTVKTMIELGVDYIPTNTMTPESLLNPSYSPVSGSKIFIRGGYGYIATDDDTNITLLSGQYDFVAASNAEMKANGNYSVTLGKDVFVSRLVAGATSSEAGTIEKSSVTVKDNAVVKDLYIVGDYGNVTETELFIAGGKVENLNNRRSGKAGTAVDIKVTIQGEGKMPGKVMLSSSSITGNKALIIKDVTSDIEYDESDWTSVKIYPDPDIVLVGAAVSAIESGTYQIPLANQKSQNDKTDWVQAAVNANIPEGNGSNAIVIYNEELEIYEVFVSKGEVIASTIITVTESLGYLVTVLAKPEGGGTVGGGGRFDQGSTVTVTASVYSGFTFVNWTEDGVEVSKEPEYTFIMGSSDRTLTANFSEETKNTYTVIFKDYDGTILKTEIVEEGEAATAPKDPERRGYTFIGWDKVFDNVISDLTVTAEYRKNKDDGDDSKSSKDNKTSTPIIHPSPKGLEIETVIDNDTITSTINVSDDIISNGKVAITIIEEQMRDIINEAIEKVMKDGDSLEPMIALNIKTSANTEKIALTLPKALVDTMANEAKVFTISTPISTITFDSELLHEISEKAAKDITITAEKANMEIHSDEIKKVIGEGALFNFEITSGEKNISQFEGNIKVFLPYTPEKWMDINAIVICRIDEQDKMEIIGDCVYDPMTGAVRFTTNHFSWYAIGYNKVFFKDVLENDWYKNAVDFISARNITFGTGDGKYSPQTEVTRAEFLVMLMRTYGIEPELNPKDNYKDAGIPIIQVILLRQSDLAYQMG